MRIFRNFDHHISDRAIRKINFLLIAVLFVITIGLTWQSTRTNRDLDTLRQSTEDIQWVVHNLEAFVDEIKEPTEEQHKRDQAISEAVKQVPEIRSILCEAFPEASECASG